MPTLIVDKLAQYKNMPKLIVGKQIPAQYKIDGDVIILTNEKQFMSGAIVRAAD